MFLCTHNACHLSPTHVISTEAADGLIVRCAVERPLYLPFA